MATDEDIAKRTATKQVVHRLRLLVNEARERGVALVADCGAVAIRVMSDDELREDNLSSRGIAVPIGGACGGAVPASDT